LNKINVLGKITIMIIGKSTHPVLVKRISVRLWSLRDEIEAALANRIGECEAAGVPVFIDDIKDFYLPKKETENNLDNVTELKAISNPENPVATDLPTDTPVTVDEIVPENNPLETQTATPENVESIATQVLEDKKETSSKNQDEILKRPLERTIPNQECISYGFSLLSDITMDGILLFSKSPYTYGQNVTMEFLIPHKFTVSGEISYCQSINKNSRIISSTKPEYRVRIKFLFQMPNERANLRNFLKSIEPNLGSATAKIPQKKSDDVNLEDLDF
jgi:hypothetical protein